MSTQMVKRGRPGRSNVTKVVKKRDATTEDALLAATAELLTERRHLDFSLAEVAERTGRSAALVQYYFGSKHGLLAALLEKNSSRSASQLNELVAMDLPAVEKLRIHVSALVRIYAKAPFIDRLLHHMIDESDDDEARRISKYYVANVVDFYRRLIDQGVREGTMRPIDPMHLYFVLLGTGDHLAARRRLLAPALGETGMDAKFAQDFGAALFDILFNGLRKE